MRVAIAVAGLVLVGLTIYAFLQHSTAYDLIGACSLAAAILAFGAALMPRGRGEK